MSKFTSLASCFSTWCHF